jgi:transcriptional regulator with XRE-family HTH domain
LNGEIEDARLDQKEVEMIAEVVGLGSEPDQLRHAGYALADCDVLIENLRYLLNSLGRGGKKTLAGDLGIDPTTVSRWLNGSFVPQTSTLRQLVSHFGLPLDIDLRVEPVFLAAQPTSAVERRNWLHNRIEGLRPDELRALYPALHRLLEER